MKAYFVPSVPTFIPESWKNDGTYTEDRWPSDAVLLTEEETETYWMVTPPDGKKLGAVDGKPAWVDIPPRTREELIKDAENERKRLLANADAVMLDWRTELMLDEISDTNRAKLSAWLAYKNEVKAVDVTADPEHVNWPVPPEA
ncbi:tail fiber assembly protein [Escherichia coli]|uniref:tail fiber assembly protein n=1 Tax=Escherichia coli TaxID=562 RepID=UPI00209A8DA9|nr:tail fiber assembly protein [Escherichia coli]MCO8139779.1 tail fiber assembly protein [Escherichia coli]